MDFVYVLLPLIIVIIAFLLFLGTYADLAKRSGIPLAGRRDLIVQPIAYTVSILAVFLPILFFVIYPLLQVDIATSINYLIPVGLATFGVLVLVGSLAIWFASGTSQDFTKCLFVSARLMLVPVIDTFWSSVAAYVTIVYAMPALAISTLIPFFSSVNQKDWLLWIIAAFFMPDFNIIFVAVFLVLGIAFAYFVFRHGPSEVLSKYFSVVSYVVLVFCVILAAYLYITFGSIVLLIDLFVIILGLIAYMVYQGVSRLYRALRVAGVFGLELAIFSVLLLLVTYKSSSIEKDLPIIGWIIHSLIPNFVWMIAYQVGILGLISGIIVIIVARRQSEKGQIMTRAMGIAIGTSAFFPLLLVISPISLPSIFGIGMSVLLVFLLVAPVYFITVNALRIIEAMKLLVQSQPAQKLCSNCGYLNRPQAVFCGKCGKKL